MATDLHGIRTDYLGEPLADELTGTDPWVLFGQWMNDAIAAGLPEPTAMTVSTVRADGRPAARVVLLKQFSPEGLVFFTNYLSAKGQELAAHPVASASFWWPDPMRQVRAVGGVRRLDRADSEAYFRSRPRPSQIAATVSRQSEELGSRAQLEAELEAAARRIGEGEVPMPEHWGGYVIEVDEFEFWQGMPSRVHDRARFTRSADGWRATRLYP